METLVIKKQKNRRALRKNKTKRFEKKFKLVGVNAAGISSKLDSLNFLLKEVQPTVFFIEETKVKTQGKIKTEYSKDYQIFELLRKNSGGGGLAIGAKNDVDPIWLAEGDDSVEVLVIQVKLGDILVRCVGAYGPQENDLVDKKHKFWERLSVEVEAAQENDTAFILQMDGNLWAGKEIIQNDVHEQNQNGKMFQEFLKKYPHLVVVNNLALCEGSITRTRKTTRGMEEAVLDFFVICNKISHFLVKMIIDEDKQYVLSRYGKKNGVSVKKDSDHNTMILYMDISYFLKKPERREIFNFKNRNCQEEFFQDCEKSTELMNCFQDGKCLESQVNSWVKTLQNKFHKSFKKIRCTSKGMENDVTKLLEKRKVLIQRLKTIEEESKSEVVLELSKVEEEISKMSSEENRNIVINNFKGLSNVDGSTNNMGIWNIKKKVFPKNTAALPFAKKDVSGKIVSRQKELKQLYLDTFTHRLRHRPIRVDFIKLKALKETLCHKRLELAASRKSSPWQQKELIKVLSKLKNGKSRDPHGLINEIFKPGVGGKDLQISLLMMMNRIKDTIFIPKYVEYATIVSIYKGRGDKMDLLSDRGIFIVNIFRSILMKLSYQEKYQIVDKNMSDSNVGGRKNKSIRNHIFVLNSVINDVIQNKKQSIDVEILDYRQCFDSMWMEECVNDLWEAGIQDDHLALIYEVNKNVNVAVKTPFGLTDRQNINRVVMQGEVYGPLCCSVQVDTFGKECIRKNKYLYKYKETVGIPPLSMVDDLVLLSTCGLNSVLMNGFINCKTNVKKLQFGVEKCHKMHVGIKNHLCPDLFIDGWELKSADSMKTGVTGLVDYGVGSCEVEKSASEKYLGDIISHDGRNQKNIEARKGKGFSTNNKIMNMIEDICFGPFTFEVSLTLRDSFLISSILTNSEAWLGLSNSEVEKLEQVDESLLRRFLEVGQGCPKEMLYLELGCMPIRYIIMIRRILFLHYLLNEEKDSLINRVLVAQSETPSKNDFIVEVEKDLEHLEIFLSLEDIKRLSKEMLSNFVKKQSKEQALIFLNTQKLKHSKVMHIKHDELNMQEYLSPQHISSLKLAKFLFAARTRMIDIGGNFSNKYGERSKCKLGCDSLDTQQHLLECKELTESDLVAADEELAYSDLFSNKVENQLKVAALLESRLKRRKEIERIRKFGN